MNILIQDDIIRRCLNFFGLRGVVQHNYENTILPTVSIGDLSQPTKISQVNLGPFAGSVPLFTVPTGETWRLIMAQLILTQSGGTVIVSYGLEMLTNSGIFFEFPQWPLVSGVAPTVRRDMTLNGTAQGFYQFPPNTLMGAGSSLIPVFHSGDGLKNQQCFLMYQILGENLIAEV